MKNGAFIQRARKNSGFSQAELADLVGVHETTIRRWESNRSNGPNSTDIAKLAQALHVTEAELLNGPERQEFEVKILMGVKDLGNMAGLEVADNCFLYGVQDDKPQIHLAGKVLIGTPEEREAARELINRKFDEACWMFDHKGKHEAVGA